jgi:peptidoglycan/xylan/chitin deacetylase (PgdA/CDA1 family)
MIKQKPRNPVYVILGVRTAQVSLFALLFTYAFHYPLTGPHALGLFLTPALCVYFVFVFVARWSWGLPILTHFPTLAREAALTFDDGPSPETTPLVLDLLRDAEVNATFFVLGEAVERHPDLLKRIVAEGHSVGIHAYRHRPFVLLSARAVQNEICRTREIICRVCPEAKLTPWLRPPHGFKTFTLVRTARRSDCRLATWNLDSRDYCTPNAESISRQVLDHLKPGAIILLHDGSENAATVEALSCILSGMAARGWQSVLLPSPLLSSPWEPAQ